MMVRGFKGCQVIMKESVGRVHRVIARIAVGCFMFHVSWLSFVRSIFHLMNFACERDPEMFAVDGQTRVYAIRRTSQTHRNSRFFLPLRCCSQNN